MVEFLVEMLVSHFFLVFSLILLFYLVESVCTFFDFSISSFINSYLGFKHATSIDGQGAADAVAAIKSFSGPFLLSNMGNTGYTVSTHEIMHVMRRLLLKTSLTNLLSHLLDDDLSSSHSLCLELW